MPTLGGHVVMNDVDGEDLFESLELAQNERAVGPGAHQADVQVIPVSLGLELGAAVG